VAAATAAAAAAVSGVGFGVRFSQDFQRRTRQIQTWAAFLILKEWLFLLILCERVDVCGNDCGGGDCDADGREATGSTGRGGHVTQERNSVSDYVLFYNILGNRKELQMCDGDPFRTERRLQI